MEASEANAMVDEGLKQAGLPDTTGVPLATPEEVAASALGAGTTSAVMPDSVPQGAPVAEPPKPADTTPAKPAESHTDLLGIEAEEAEPPKPAAGQQTVPVVVVADLREKLRQLKAENEQLRQAGNAPPAETGEELADIERTLSDKQDDDLLTVAETKKILGAIRTTTSRITQAATNRIELTERAAFKKAVLGAEVAARQAHADYDTTMKFAKTMGGFSRAEVAAAYRSDNPMEYLYGVAQNRIAVARQTFGIPAPVTPSPANPSTVTTPTGQQPGAEKVPTDDDIFESAFGTQPAAVPKTG